MPILVVFRVLSDSILGTDKTILPLPGSLHILITSFIVFLSLRLRDFLYDVFRLQGKMGKTKWKINKLLCNIFVTLFPKATKNQDTKIRWKGHWMFLSKYLLMWKFEKRPLLDLHSVPHIDPEFQNYCCCHHILHRRTIGTYLGFFRNKIWEHCQGIFQSLFSASKYLKIKEKKN